MNNFKRMIAAFAVAMALSVTLGCKALQFPAESQNVAPAPREQALTTQERERTPATREQASPTADRQLPTTDNQLPTITSRQPRQLPTKCIDGSPLAVTSRDSNQTNYRCGSGAIGAFTN
jgi:hypothetical protein